MWGLSCSCILSDVACLALAYCQMWPVLLLHTVRRGLSCSCILSDVACLALAYCQTWPVLFLHIVRRGLSCSCILSDVACLALAYCQKWPVLLLHIFHLIPQKVRFSKKKFMEQKNVCFEFLYKFCLKYTNNKTNYLHQCIVLKLLHFKTFYTY